MGTRKKKKVGSRAHAAVSFETIRDLALALPEAEEGTSYRTPAFRVRGKLFARMHQSEDAVVLRTDFFERDVLMDTRPEAFYVTDHYEQHPWVLARLSTVRLADLRRLVRRAWRLAAPESLDDDPV